MGTGIESAGTDVLAGGGAHTAHLHGLSGGGSEDEDRRSGGVGHDEASVAQLTHGAHVGEWRLDAQWCAGQLPRGRLEERKQCEQNDEGRMHSVDAPLKV